MKKFWIRLAVYMAGVVAVAWGNNAVLLHFHPLEYYYTPAGMLITAVVCCVEAVTLWPFGSWLMDHWVVPTLHEGQKESIITEFKED